MAKPVHISTLCFYGVLLAVQANYNPYMDNIFFDINWSGPEMELNNNKEALTDGSSIVLRTKNNEQYKCFIPDVSEEATLADIANYNGPSEWELLKSLFDQTSCSYRVESYWTYELCHGKFLRQYHEEKEVGKKSKLQEYFLGHYDLKDEKDPNAHEQTQIPPPPTGDTVKPKVPTKKVEGIEIAYYAVPFKDGTPCDLTGGSRTVAIQYVCHAQGKGEIYELKESSTCQYEVIVLTKLLCKHPAYEPKKDHVNKIQCHSLTGSPKRPKSLDQLHLENTQGRYNRKEDEGDEDFEDDEMKGPTHNLPKKDKTTEYVEKTVPPRDETPISSTTDKQLLQEFLSGEYCLQGGSGWWKHEFCYSKSVTQFHEDKNGKTVIVLGKKKKVPTATLR